MSILLLSKNSKKFIEKKNIKNIIIDLDYIEENCAQIYDPRVRTIKDRDLYKFENLPRVSNGELTLYISKPFITKFGRLDEFQLDVGGMIKKGLFLSNVEPIIIDTCNSK
ncbi:hypothetical protein LCGC14_0745840 [marine sediment metagenome]|uniref:Uncharacterized protein n=1 Tax=marine sediment metagenome TaxID=412755 RepID=A0A0F9Q5D8_9ZZZZ|nr:MAG: hypothetical protein Lokiarch_23200 [Candidatus Lokiarchaeum sp. GC14_75]